MMGCESNECCQEIVNAMGDIAVSLTNTVLPTIDFPYLSPATIPGLVLIGITPTTYNKLSPIQINAILNNLSDDTDARLTAYRSALVQIMHFPN